MLKLRRQRQSGGHDDMVSADAPGTPAPREPRDELREAAELCDRLDGATLLLDTKRIPGWAVILSQAEARDIQLALEDARAMLLARLAHPEQEAE